MIRIWCPECQAMHRTRRRITAEGQQSFYKPTGDTIQLPVARCQRHEEERKISNDFTQKVSRPTR